MNESVLWPGRLFIASFGGRRRIIAPPKRESQLFTLAGIRRKRGEPSAMPVRLAKHFSPRRLMLLAAFVLVGAVAGFVYLRGGWTAFVRINPILDASTPKMQNGFTLVRVEVADKPGDPAALTLWIRPPYFPAGRMSSYEQEGETQYQLPGPKET